jgi:DNA-binding transcriptional MerR regulator
MSASGFRIGEVAKRAGVSIDTIRYYEKRSLLPRAPRSSGGYRVFTPDAIGRVRFIKQAQEIGLTLDEIRTLLTGGGAGECRHVSDVLRSKLADIDQRMKALREFRRMLSRHLRSCEDELAKRGEAATCPVLIEINYAARGKANK